jgi:hypothetical protein
LHIFWRFISERDGLEWSSSVHSRTKSPSEGNGSFLKHPLNQNPTQFCLPNSAGQDVSHGDFDDDSAIFVIIQEKAVMINPPVNMDRIDNFPS